VTKVFPSHFTHQVQLPSERAPSAQRVHLERGILGIRRIFRSVYASRLLEGANSDAVNDRLGLVIGVLIGVVVDFFELVERDRMGYGLATEGKTRLWLRGVLVLRFVALRGEAETQELVNC
jgi:hypothetical protein